MEMIIKLSSIMEIPNKGIVLICDSTELNSQESVSLKRLVGSNIIIKNKDGNDVVVKVKDVSVSFSITGDSLIGINIVGDINSEDIKKDFITVQVNN